MRISRGTLAIALMAALSLSACGGGKAPRLMNIANNHAGPDEFAILPGKPLQTPKNLSELPAPTPGGTNLTDPTPVADAVAALGGKPARLAASSSPRADSAILAQATRYGVAPGIRKTLAAEDLKFRRSHKGRLLERAFNVNVYFKAYRKQALDQYRALAQFRRMGIYTPAAPPNRAAKP